MPTNVPIKNKTYRTGSLTNRTKKVVHQFLVGRSPWRQPKPTVKIADKRTGIGTMRISSMASRMTFPLFHLTRNLYNRQQKKSSFEKWIIRPMKKSWNQIWQLEPYRFAINNNFFQLEDIKLKREKHSWGGNPLGIFITITFDGELDLIHHRNRETNWWRIMTCS